MGKSTDRPGDPSWIQPLPGVVPSVTHVRGTLIVASREQLRRTGTFEKYVEATTPSARSPLAEIVASIWVPVAIAHEHFAALDRLDLDLATIESNTGVVASKLNGTFLRTVARAMGVTPWAGVRVLGAAWGRVFQGGAVGFRQVGPKDAVVAIAGNPLTQHFYHRVGLRIHMTHGLQMFASGAFVREAYYRASRHELGLRMQWV